jgi:hypothetical protein
MIEYDILRSVAETLAFSQNKTKKGKSSRHVHDERRLLLSRETASTPSFIFDAFTKITTKPLVA